MGLNNTICQDLLILALRKIFEIICQVVVVLGFKILGFLIIGYIVANFGNVVGNNCRGPNFFNFFFYEGYLGSG